MQPQRERVKLGKDRNWWRLLPVLGALGLIGFMLVLTFMPSRLDDANLEPSVVALLGSPTPSIQPSPTLIAAPFPAWQPEKSAPPIQVLPADPGEVRLATIEPAFTSVPTKDLHDAELLPTIVPIIEQPTTMIPAATIVLQTPTTLPTLTAQPTPVGQIHSYAIIVRADTAQYQLVLLEATDFVPIATVDEYAASFMALLPEQQTLLLPRNQNLVAIDLKTGQPRWSMQLLPKKPYDRKSRLTIDNTGSGVYVLDQSSDDARWTWSHLAIQDGQLLDGPSSLPLPGHSHTMTSDGKIWGIDDDQLFQFDPRTMTKRDFGALRINSITGDGTQPFLGVFRASTSVSLIDWASGNEQQVALNPPFHGNLFSATFSNDQQTLVVESIVSSDDPRADDVYLSSVYNLQTGQLLGISEVANLSSIYPGITADQWLISSSDWEREQRLVSRWNVATNSLTEVVPASVWGDHGIVWLGDLAGPAINLPNSDYQAAVTPLPTIVPMYDQPNLPTIQPPSIEPVAIFGDRLGTDLRLQRLSSDQTLDVLVEEGAKLFERYNQPPLVLHHPKSKTWQLVDLVSQQTVEWEFEKILSDESFINSILAPNYQSMVALVGQDLRSNDQFTGASQLLQINTQTGAWNVLADSRSWPELKWSTPLAWQGDSIYFLQASKNPQLLWRVQLGPPFQAEKIAEIPAIVANIPDVSSAILARVYVSPNQRWLIYPLATANKTMVLRVLDLVKQQSHDIALPLMPLAADDLSFSPEGNSFAFMLPTAEGRSAPALYQFEQQRWYQLDSGEYFESGESPFLWSPDGHWLLLDFATISREQRLGVYNAQQPSLVFSTQRDPLKEPVALYNDGKTLLAQHLWQPSLEQLSWNGQALQIDWRISEDVGLSEEIYYVYPR
ncbi:hypothetical protein [Herpetosiphon geysericola]|uniref:Uncharacterized protein n=1 Tax=Herpetosiphon geysericola TaxID=70996 RepID=A0A0P6Z3H0_9CHLR|nr:hypothetical protein [Herpetosiphon geysericola]KPL91988.1 hypothetical protein SE18_00060 [Herpetosiphon geysericola]